MKHSRLRQLLFLALCCDLGLFAKQLIAPAANLLTDALHIPGGVSTGFSLLFLVIAASMVPRFGCATGMGLVQSLIAIALGRIGSMGALSPLGYIVPGIVIDGCLRIFRKFRLTDRMVLTNMFAAVSASLTANLIIFRLQGAPLILYLCISASSGALCGLLGSRIVPLISRAVSFGRQKGNE